MKLKFERRLKWISTKNLTVRSVQGRAFRGLARPSDDCSDSINHFMILYVVNAKCGSFSGTGAGVFIAFVLFVKKKANDRLYATPDQVSSCMSNTV